MSTHLLKIRDRVIPIFKHYGVIRADVFGSVAKGRATRSSDLDLLVTLKKPIGLFKFNEFNDALEETLHTKVDLLTHQSVNPRLKPYITKDLVRIYEAE